MAKIWVETGLTKRKLFIVLLAFLLVGIIIYLWNVLLPFITGLLTAYILDPIVKKLETNRFLTLKRSVGVPLIFLIFISIFVIITLVLFKTLNPDSLKPLIKDIPKYGKIIENEYHTILKKFELSGLPIDADEIRKKLFNEAETFLKHILSSLKNLFKYLLDSVIFFLLFPLSTFYFLMDKEKIFSTLKKYVKDEKEEQIKEIYNEVDKKIGGYIKGQFFTSLLVAIIVTIILVIFDIPYNILFGVIAGIANIIPYFGPIIGAASPIIIAIAVPAYSVSDVILLILFFVILNGIVGFVITPKITSKTVNIHPLIVILVIFVGNSLFGIIGMILAVPVAIIIKVFLLLLFKSYIKKI